jgi:hypothetical protein
MQTFDKALTETFEKACPFPDSSIINGPKFVLSFWRRIIAVKAIMQAYRG